MFLAVTVTVGAMIAAGCGSTSGTDTETASVTNSERAETPPAETSTSANPDGSIPEATDVTPSEVNDAAQEGPLTVAEAANRKRDRLLAGPDTRSGPMPEVKLIKRAAPDDSEYWSTLTDVAREYRQFKSDPQINRVERWNDGTNSVLKIHLKNGKVVEQPGERVRNLATESVSTFVRLAGLPARPLATPEASAAENPNKKKEDTGRP